MLTMNYQGLKEKYSKPKKKKKTKSQKTFKNHWESLETNNSSPTKRKAVRDSGNVLKTYQEQKLAYQEQLNDERWKEKRLQIMKRDGFKCALCGSKHNLLVHHTRYENGKMAWEYSDSTLVTLCKDCHVDVHYDYKHYLHPKYEEIWYSIDLKGLEDYEATRFGRIRHKDTKKRIQWNHLGMWSDDNDTQKILVNGKWVSKSEVLEKLY